MKRLVEKGEGDVEEAWFLDGSGTPPFTIVEVLRTGLVTAPDGAIEVAAMVRATDAGGRTQMLEYTVVVEQRDRRWEVSRLLPAPTLTPSETN